MAGRPLPQDILVGFESRGDQKYDNGRAADHVDGVVRMLDHCLNHVRTVLELLALWFLSTVPELAVGQMASLSKKCWVFNGIRMSAPM